MSSHSLRCPRILGDPELLYLDSPSGIGPFQLSLDDGEYRDADDADERGQQGVLDQILTALIDEKSPQQRLDPRPTGEVR